MFNSIDRYIRRGQRQVANQLQEFMEWFVIQAFLSAVVNIWFSPLGFLVNVGFLLFTGLGFLSEIGSITRAWEDGKVAKFAYAVFALVVDILLNVYIH